MLRALNALPSRIWILGAVGTMDHGPHKKWSCMYNYGPGPYYERARISKSFPLRYCDVTLPVSWAAFRGVQYPFF